MIVNLNFNLEAWVKNLSIVAQSEEEAINKLMGMTLAEILEEDPVVDSDMKISDIETSIEASDVIVQISEIEYDLDPEIMDLSVIEYLKNFLPSELKLTISNVAESDDLEERIQDKIYSETDYDVKSFKFRILEKR